MLGEHCFAPLLLAHLALAGIHDDAWSDAFAAWWCDEPETIGLDPERRWLHSVAHGADDVEVLAVRRFVPRRRCSAGALSACSPTSMQPRRGRACGVPGDTRVAVALRTVLRNCPDQLASRWAADVTPAATFAQPAPIPAARSNTIRTLRAVVAAIACDVDADADLDADTVRRERSLCRRLAPLMALPASERARHGALRPAPLVLVPDDEDSTLVSPFVDVVDGRGERILLDTGSSRSQAVGGLARGPAPDGWTPRAPLPWLGAV